MTATNTKERKKRNPLAFYPTPGWCVRELYKAFPDLPPPELDPCAGDGALLEAAPAPMMGVEIAASRAAAHPDIIHGDGIDFLRSSGVTFNILMNPPFHHAATFLRATVGRGMHTVCLLRISYVGSKKRLKLWGDLPRPARLVILTDPRPFADSTEYAWFVFDPQTTDNKTKIDWLTKSGQRCLTGPVK